MALANIEASRLGSSYIELGHVLLALLKPQECTLYQFLKDMDYDVDQFLNMIRQYALKTIKENTSGIIIPKVSQEVNDAIVLAITSAKSQGTEYISPLNILYGIIQICRVNFGKELQPQISDLEARLLPPPQSTNEH